MAQERRAYPRRPVHWQAQIAGDGLSEQQVTIRDFCAGGLFLEYPGQGQFRPSSETLPERIDIRFEDPSSGDVCHCDAQIARDAGHGLAVAFGQPRLDVVTILSGIAQGQSDPNLARVVPGPSTQVADEVISACRRQAVAVMERVLPVFTVKTIDALSSALDEARATADKDSLNEASLRLRQGENDFISAVVGELDDRLRLLRESPPENTNTAKGDPLPESIDELELVDDDEFEDWLNRSAVISHAEYQFSSELERLSRRLSQLTDREINEQTNPIGPAVLSDILETALPFDRPSKAVARTLYAQFSRHVLDQLGSLYEQLNQTLRGYNILPDLEQERPEIRSLGGTDRWRWMRLGTGGAIFRSEQPPIEPVGAAGSQTDGHLSMRLDKVQPPASGPAPSAAEATPVDDISEDYRTEAHENRRAIWLSMQKTLRMAQEAFTNSGELKVAETSAAEPSETTAAINESAESPLASTATPSDATDTHESVLERLLSGLGVAAVTELSDDQQDIVQSIADWFEDIAANPINSDVLRDWSRELASVALAYQSEFLAATRYPIHDLLDQWDRAALAVAAVPAQQRTGLRQRIDAILRQVSREYGSDGQALATAASRLSALVDAPLDARAANLQRITEKYEGAKRLEEARAHVSRNLDSRLAGRQVPEPLIRFVADYWHHVLVLIRLGAGVDNEHWQRGLAVVDRLLTLLGVDNQPGRPVPEHDKVFAFIHKQLDAFGRRSPEVVALLDDMKRRADAICAGGQVDDELSVAIAPAMAERPASPEGLDPYWLGVVKLMATGHWIHCRGDGDSDGVYRLQWINDNRTRYVFADQAGEGVVEYTQDEFANRLKTGQIELAGNLDAPLCERQWHRRILASHETIIDLASTDSETGLLDRKAFMRAIQSLEARHRKGRPRDHALLCVEWTATNGSDHSAVTKEITGLAASELASGLNGGDVIARNGRQGFLLLLPDRTAARAEIEAEELRRRLEELAGERAPSTSVKFSIGLVGFQLGGAQQSSDALAEAESACAGMVADGGSGVRAVRASEHQVASLRHSLKSAARLDAALEAGDLQLRGQRILPLRPSTSGLGPLHEILIAVGSGDENEQLLSPAQFIPAAEQFGRMASVDRWVIRRVLEWCREHPRQARGVDTFTINLAAATLEDEDLPVYVSEELQRTGVTPGSICFEFGEAVAVQNLGQVVDLVTRIRSLGCHFAIADVGTGRYAGQYLGHLPVDYIKIDGRFVRNINCSDADAALVASLNQLAHHLGKMTIAEFVEDDTICERLESIGLDYVQGYGIRNPEPLDNIPTV